MYESRTSLLKQPSEMTITTLIRLEIEVATPMAKMGSSVKCVRVYRMMGTCRAVATIYAVIYKKPRR